LKNRIPHGKPSSSANREKQSRDAQQNEPFGAARCETGKGGARKGKKDAKRRNKRASKAPSACLCTGKRSFLTQEESSTNQ